MPNKDIVQVPVERGDVEHINVQRLSGNDVEAFATYRVRTSTGEYIGGTRGIGVPLTGPQKTSLLNFIDNVILPAANAVEGT